MKDALKFFESAARVAPLGVKTALGSALQALELRPVDAATSCKPIVFMHGFAGFRELQLGSWTLLEYFHRVRRLLRAMGYQAFAPEVAPFDDPLDRARQWFSALEKIRERTGADQVHLIGHSQGGLDARVLTAPAGPAQETPIGPLFGLGYGAHVASVTTIATPHFGSAIADEVLQGRPVHQEAVSAFLEALQIAVSLVRGETQDVEHAVQALSREFMLEHFNRVIEDDPEVRYYAVAGDPLSSHLVYPFLRPAYQALSDMDPSEGGGPNDALVTVAGSLFGNLPPAYEDQEYAELVAHRRPKWKPLGVVQADHIAEVGIPLQLRRPKTYDHLALFAGLAQFLDDAYAADMSLQSDGQWERTPRRPPVPMSVASLGAS